MPRKPPPEPTRTLADECRLMARDLNDIADELDYEIEPDRKRFQQMRLRWQRIETRLADVIEG